MTVSIAKFLEDRTAPAKDELDWTRFPCLFAHYRRWAFFHGYRSEEPEDVVEFQAALGRIKCKRIDGRLFYALELIDAEPEKAAERGAPRVQRQDRVLGRLRMTQECKFVDGVLALGDEVVQLAVRDHERDRLKELEQREVAHSDGVAVPWLVVEFQGKRRWIPGRCATRVVS